MIWYALTVAPQKEFVAEKVLKNMGHDALVPVEFKWRRADRYSNKKKVHPYAMMNGYVFAGFNGHVPWMQLRETPCITGVVGFQGEPAQIPTKAVNDIRELSGQEIAFMKSIDVRRSFRAGDMVRVSSGPLQGQFIKIKRIVADRAHSIFEFFNRTYPIELPLEILEAA